MSDNFLDEMNDEFEGGDINTSSPAAPPPPPAEVSIEVPGVDGRMEVFKGKDYQEVAQRIADAKRYANQHIQTLQQERMSYQDEPQHQYTPQEVNPLTADEAFALSQGRYNEVAPRLFEVATGTPAQMYQQKMQMLDAMIEGKYAEEAVQGFLSDDANLDYYPSDYNRQQMEAFMNSNYPGQTWSKQGLDVAYTYLRTNGLLEQYPEQDQPVSMSTGISDRMATSESPFESTAEDWSKLSREEHKQRLRDAHRQGKY